MILEISENSQENTCARVSFLVPGLRPATLLKKKLWCRCFTVNFAKFLRKLFLQDTSVWLLLASYNKLVIRYYDIFFCQVNLAMNHSLTKQTNTFSKKTNCTEKMHEIFSKLTIKTSGRHKWRHLVFICLTFNMLLRTCV